MLHQAGAALPRRAMSTTGGSAKVEPAPLPATDGPTPAQPLAAPQNAAQKEEVMAPLEMAG